MIQITYQKRDGSIMQRYRNTPLPYNIGDETSMGWKVLNIQYEFKNNYYPHYKYCKLMKSRIERMERKRQTINACLKESKTILYYFIVVIIISYLKILLGI